MRLGIRSANPLVWLLEAVGILPTPLLVAFWGMESSRAIIAAAELGLFEPLTQKPLTARELAKALDYDEVGVEALLNALNGFGYLRRRGGRFTLTRSTRRWLTRDAKYSMVRPMGLFRVLWDELADMEDRVRHGGDRDFHRPDRDPEFWRRYEVGLGEFARLTAPSIARSVRFSSAPRRLLDVGGGHGAYSAAFCDRHPGLHATVLDLPQAAAVGRELTEERGLSDRVTYLEGDLTTVPWGDGYDVVLIFNLLHILSPESALETVQKAYAALRPGGTLVVVDSAHRGRSGNIDAVGGGSELLFYAINGTRSYPEDDMVAWVRGAGFDRVHVGRLLAMPEAVITAVKPH